MRPLRSLPFRAGVTSSSERDSVAQILGLVKAGLNPGGNFKPDKATESPVVPHSYHVPGIRTEKTRLSGQEHGQQDTLDGVQRLLKTTNRLIDITAHTQLHTSKGWERTRSRRGENIRLENTLKAAMRENPALGLRPSSQRVEAEEEFVALEENLDLVPRSIPPGTFVEVRKSPSPMTGIVIGNAIMNGRSVVLTLTITGHTVEHFDADVLFEIPKMITYGLSQRAGIGALPNTRTETSARVEILRHLRDFEHQVANAYSVIQALNVDLYALIKSTDPEEWSSVTVTRAAELISGKRHGHVASLFATHRYLMKHSEEFVPQSSTHRTMQTFDVRPQSHLVKLRAVKDMIYSSNPAIDMFVSKAQIIMAENRERRKESWDEPPTREVDKSVTYTAEDRSIIDVLQHGLRRHWDVVTDPYSIVISTILKKLQVPGNLGDTSVLQETLVDLGHLAPWEDVVSRRRELNLDQCPDTESTRVIAQNRIVERNLSRLPSVSTEPLGVEDFYPHDPVDHLRHDFGDMPVYIVDDVGAEELDDGLSVEEIPSEPGSAWVHVHIADPTALIPPTHVFARQAYRQGMTCYLTHRTWPMFPTSLTRSKLSLGSRTKYGEPEPVLTFSFKVDPVGNMVDYDVRAGLIRKVVAVDYDSLDHHLGTRSPAQASRPFELDDQPGPTAVTALGSEHTSNVRLLADIIIRHRMRNLNSSKAFIAVLPYARTSIVQKPLYGAPLHSPDPFRFRGFPSISYQVLSQKIQETGSRMMIAECMKAACRVASRWLTDRDVPMLRRTSKPPVPLGDSRALEKVLAARDSDGFVDFYLVQKANLHIPPVEHTLRPDMHWSMGVQDGEGYIRVTSPLRRYSDLVAHWQIKSALLHPTGGPVFSRQWLTGYAPEIKAKERLFKEVERTHYAYWTALYLKRFMEDPRGVMENPGFLGSLTANVLFKSVYDNEKGVHCHIPCLGLKATLHVPSGVQIDVGDSLDVRIADIQVGLRPRISVVPK